MDPALQYAIFFFTGIVTGTASGLFGVGGGFLMTPVQFWLHILGGMDGTVATRVAFGTSLAVMIPTMVSGSLAHADRGAVNWKAAGTMGCAAVLGGFFGGTLAAHLPGIVLRGFFAVLIIVMAVRMAWHLRSCEVCEPRGSTPGYVLTGLLVGTVSGLAGIGGGILLVPVLVMLFGYPMHSAVGTSSACLIFSSAGAVTAYIINGIGTAGRTPLFSRVRERAGVPHPCCHDDPGSPVRGPVCPWLFRPDAADHLCLRTGPYRRADAGKRVNAPPCGQTPQKSSSQIRTRRTLRVLLKPPSWRNGARIGLRLPIRRTRFLFQWK